MSRSSLVIAAVMGASLVSPAVAADRMAILDYGYDRTATAGYAGATLSLLRSREGQARPVLRFGAGMRHKLNSASSAGMASNLVEFRLAGPGNDGLYLGGRRLSAAEGNGGLHTGQVFLIVAGIAAAALLVTQVAGSDNDDDEERCLLPEGCN